MASHVLKTALQLQILAIYLLVQAIGTINPFKQPKRALELKSLNFNKLQVFCLPACQPACLPDHNNQPTA